jgi:hypothetical protein
MHSSITTQAVSATVGLVCLVAAGLIWTVGNRHTPRLVVALVITGMVGLTSTTFGGWSRQIMAWLNTTDRLTGRLTGVVVVGLVAAVALYVLVIHVRRNSIGNKTLVSAAIVPLAVTSIPGPIGAAAVTLVSAISGSVAWAITSAFGWH